MWRRSDLQRRLGGCNLGWFRSRLVLVDDYHRWWWIRDVCFDMDQSSAMVCTTLKHIGQSGGSDLHMGWEPYNTRLPGFREYPIDVDCDGLSLSFPSLCLFAVVLTWRLPDTALPSATMRSFLWVHVHDHRYSLDCKINHPRG